VPLFSAIVCKALHVRLNEGGVLFAVHWSHSMLMLSTLLVPFSAARKSEPRKVPLTFAALTVSTVTQVPYRTVSFSISSRERMLHSRLIFYLASSSPMQPPPLDEIHNSTLDGGRFKRYGTQ
jgi:hypothetical protein